MPKDRTLPHNPVVGDKIRLKAEHITSVMQAAEQAGYDVDPYAIRTVTRKDPWAPGGGERLFVEGTPHCFLPRQVVLAWNTDEERRETGERACGWLTCRDSIRLVPGHNESHEGRRAGTTWRGSTPATWGSTTRR